MLNIGQRAMTYIMRRKRPKESPQRRWKEIVLAAKRM